MSDLQCAATLLIACHGDREQARELADALRDRRVAMVYSSSKEPAGQSAKTVAAELGVTARVVDGLDNASGLLAELESAADLHRGETVLFVSNDDAIRAALSHLAGPIRTVSADGGALGNCDVVEVAVDADGWVLRTWAGESVG